MRKNINGFTIVELLVVIAIIGILTTIGIVSFTRVRSDSRDTKRSSNITIIAEALEKYYDKNGVYPTCADMTQSSNLVTSNTLLSGMDSSVLTSPNADSGTNSIVCTDPSNTDNFGYIGGGSQYTLEYKEESTGNIESLTSRRNTDSSTLANTTVSPTVENTTQIKLTWSVVTGATSYNWQLSTNNFTDILSDTNTTNTTATVSELTPGMKYYFRVMPKALNSTASWSTIADSTTSINAPSIPTMSAALASTSAVGTSSTATCASGIPQYELRYHSTNIVADGIWSDWTAWSPSVKTMTIANTLQGYKYTFQAYARCQGPSIASTSSVSNVDSVIRAINTPIAPTYLGPSSFISWQYVNINYTNYCPSGTSLLNGTFHSEAEGTLFGPHPFGFLDHWYNDSYPARTMTAEYWGKYQCQTAYSTSAFSPESYNTASVYK